MSIITTNNFGVIDKAYALRLLHDTTVADSLMNDMIDRVLKEMHHVPVIILCPYCNSQNVFTNPTCVQCGAPMGDQNALQIQKTNEVDVR